MTTSERPGGNTLSAAGPPPPPTPVCRGGAQAQRSVFGTICPSQLAARSAHPAAHPLISIACRATGTAPYGGTPAAPTTRVPSTRGARQGIAVVMSTAQHDGGLLTSVGTASLNDVDATRRVLTRHGGMPCPVTDSCWNGRRVSHPVIRCHVRTLEESAAWCCLKLQESEMYVDRWASKMVRAAQLHLEIVRTALADGRVSADENDMIEASAEDLKIYAGIVDSGDRVAQASQRAGDGEYLGGLLAEYSAWVAKAPPAA